MSDLLLDFITYLKNQTIITDDGIDGFRDRVPATPDDCAYLIEYKSSPSGIGNLGHRWIQFNYRSKSYSMASNKCMQMFKLFGITDEDVTIQLTSNRWALVRCTSGPFKSGVDEQGRTIFTFNAKVITFY